MKQIFLLFLLLSTIQLLAQKKYNGYAFLGPAIYFNTKSSDDILYGGTFGFSHLTKRAAIGLTVDFLTQENSGIYMPVYGDLHGFLSNKTEGVFILAQPGYIIRSKTFINGPGYKISESGGFYFGAGLGFVSKILKTGFTCQLKYVLFNTQVNSSVYGGDQKINNTTKAVAMSLAVAF